MEGHNRLVRCVHDPFYHSALRRDPPPMLATALYPTRSSQTLIASGHCARRLSDAASSLPAMAQLPPVTSMATYSPSWSASTAPSRPACTSHRRDGPSPPWACAGALGSLRSPFALLLKSFFYIEHSTTTGDFMTTERPRTRASNKRKIERLRVRVSRWRVAGLTPRLVFSVSTRHTTGIASPWCADRLPSDISKMAVSTVSGGGA